MVAELNHRVKNVLAIVQSLAFQTLHGSDVPDEVGESFSARLQALASAHDLLTEERWEGANIRNIALGALEPLAPNLNSRVLIEGEDLQLNPQVAVSLSMAFHELATNAAKYGALSNSQGQVDLCWRIAGDGAPRLVIEWRERDGPRVMTPEHKGFGTRMISRVIGSNMRGKVDLRFEPDGVRCTIDAPLEGVTRTSNASTTSAQAVELTR
jgi:two-component sensor histidine kinase